MDRPLGWLVLAALAACGTEDGGVTYWVSRAGDDAWPGTRTQPFQTLRRAQQAVHAADRRRGDVVIRIEPGTYYLDAPIELTEEDSGDDGHTVIYRADGAPGSARILGGFPIERWTHGAGRIVTAQMPPGVRFHTLYEDGVRADIARYPNRDARLPLARASYLRSAGGTSSVLEYADGDLPDLGGEVAQLQVLVWPFEHRDWFTDIVPVTAFDPATRQITLAQATRYIIGADARYFVQNAPSLLDAPGEMYLDETTGVLSYWPRGDIDHAEVIVPTMQTVLSIRGAHDLRIEGLWLADSDFTDWYRFGFPDGTFERQIEMEQNRLGLVTMEDTERVEIVSSRISNSGFGGIYMLFANQHDRIYGNLIEHTGINAITVQGGFPGTGDVSHDNVLSNNLLRFIGEQAGNAAGIDISNSGSNEVSYSWIHDSSRYGVIIHAIARQPGELLYAQDNLVDHVLIEDVCQDSGDVGALYEIGVSMDGTAPRPNTFRQIIIDGAFADPSMHDLPPDGVFLDFDTGGQTFQDIQVSNVGEALYRSNEDLPQTFDNVSWEPGFDPTRIDAAAIGLRSDFPAEYLR